MDLLSKGKCYIITDYVVLVLMHSVIY